MASSRLTSNGPDWRDVHQGLINLERLCGQRITLSIHSAGLDGAQYLVLEAKTEVGVGKDGEVLPSAFVSATMRSLNVTTLSAAFLNLLHKVDAQLWQEDTGS